MSKVNKDNNGRLSALLKRYRQIILYVIFGGLTTVVDFTVSLLMYHVTDVHFANVTAWVAAVVFAYVVNKIWVFESKTKRACEVVSEFLAFCGGRVLSLLLQEALFFIFVDLLTFDRVVIKMISAVVVVITNYILSKLVFNNRKKQQEREKTNETEL